MRTLEVKRRKQFVAAAMKVRICIETTEEEATVHLKDAHLEVIGVLKNGKSIQVEIPEEPVNVYAVFDKLFQDRFHFKYLIGAGSTPEVLHLYSRYNPIKGNPFVLSPNETLTKADQERIKSHAVTSKSKTFQVFYWIIVIAFAVVGYIIGMSLF